MISEVDKTEKCDNLPINITYLVLFNKFFFLGSSEIFCIEIISWC